MGKAVMHVLNAKATLKSRRLVKDVTVMDKYMFITNSIARLIIGNWLNNYEKSSCIGDNGIK